jgi:hypothetical protein
VPLTSSTLTEPFPSLFSNGTIRRPPCTSGALDLPFAGTVDVVLGLTGAGVGAELRHES